MRLRTILLTNFRCFTRQQLDFNAPVVVLEGPNGSGKTTILEALFYSCYLRSFRTHLSREIMQRGSDHFFVQVGFENTTLGLEQEIQIGVSADQKTVKLDGRTIHTYKEIVESFSVVSATEEDIALVSGSPEMRRLFLNHALMLDAPCHVQALKVYRGILAQRNRLIQTQSYRLSEQSEELIAWSRQLWEQACVVQAARQDFLSRVQDKVNQLLKEAGDGLGLSNLRVVLTYQRRHAGASQFEEFWDYYRLKNILEQERRLGRSLFGAHLDDIAITFEQHRARAYASRGQQKLVVFLIKLAQAWLLEEASRPLLLLLDDFLTDFDQSRLESCFSLLGRFKGQVVISSPFSSILKAQTSKIVDAEHLSL